MKLSNELSDLAAKKGLKKPTHSKLQEWMRDCCDVDIVIEPKWENRVKFYSFRLYYLRMFPPIVMESSTSASYIDYESALDAALLEGFRVIE